MVSVLCSKRLLYSCSSTPRFFCFHGTRRPIPRHPISADACQVATEIDSPDPSKSRKPGSRRASTIRTRFQAATTVPEEVNQTLRICSQFLSGQKYRVRGPLDIFLYCALYSRPTRHTKRENRAYFGARYTPTCTLLAAA